LSLFLDLRDLRDLKLAEFKDSRYLKLAGLRIDQPLIINQAKNLLMFLFY